jgi:hypothetical protein
MEYCLAMKKNEIMSLAGKLMKLKTIILNEIRQAQKAQYHMFSLICET